MRQILFILALVPLVSFSQKVIPFVDFNNYFRSFSDETFKMVEFQKIIEFKAGDEFVSYLDNKGNLRLYDGTTPKDITNLINLDYRVSDHLMAWQISGTTLNMWDAGQQRTLTYNSRNFEVRDSIIVYEDLRYNNVSVYWNGKITTLYTVVDSLYMPDFIGENIVGFRDNGNFYKIFWNGTIYDIGVWNGTPIQFQGGTDIMAFNDPTNRTFAVFDKGEFTDVESFYMGKYKAGRGFVVYEDLNGNLNHYESGQKTQLSNFSAKFWEVKDDIVVWSENSFIYLYGDGKKNKVCSNYTPPDYALKNDVFVYRNVMGGVSAFVKGVNYEITNQTDSQYTIYGSSVLVKLFNQSYIVLKNGKKYNT